jgi:hypothetical protein
MSPRRTLALGLLLAACSSAPASTSGAGGSGASPPSEPPPWEHPTVGAGSESQPAPTDLFGEPRPPAGRSVRRMPLDTLSASMSRAAGNDVYGAPIEWKVNGKNGFSDAAFGKALGRPDFQASTEESGVSSALYLKFVGDAARSICLQMGKNDLLRGDASTRALFPKAPIDGTATEAQLTENLQYLVLRFVGLRLEPSHEMVTKLRAVFDAGKSAAVPTGGTLPPDAEAWRGVCVALFESPLFHND